MNRPRYPVISVNLHGVAASSRLEMSGLWQRAPAIRAQLSDRAAVLDHAGDYALLRRLSGLLAIRRL